METGGKLWQEPAMQDEIFGPVLSVMEAATFISIPDTQSMVYLPTFGEFVW